MTNFLSAFFIDEYNRFMQGIETLAMTDAERVATTRWRDLRDAAKARVVSIPQWDDVLHLRPRPPVTQEQRDRYWENRRAGREQDLPAAALQEIERRRGRIDAMRRSAQPEFDRAWGAVLTATDNVQDFLASVAVLGRIGLLVGGKLGLRAIPGLGTTLLAADLLSIAMLVGQWAFAGWLTACAGPRAGLRAGVGAALTKAAFKGSTNLLARTAARGLFWRTAYATTTTVATARGFREVVTLTAAAQHAAPRIVGLLGALLVVGQTTDQLFGLGISLGPIVGGIMGAVYGAEAAARGVEVEIRTGPSVAHIGPLVRPRLAELPRYALIDRMRAAEILATAPLVLAEQSPADQEERIAHLVALVPALELLIADTQGTGYAGELDRLRDWPVPPPLPAPHGARWQALADPGLAGWPLEWPHGWGARGYIAPHAVNVVPEAVSAGLAALVDGLRNRPEGALVGACLNQLVEMLFTLYTEDDAFVRPRLAPDFLALERLATAGLVLAPRSDPARVESWWAEALALVGGGRHQLKTADEWIALFDKHDVEFVRMLPPTFEPLQE